MIKASYYNQFPFSANKEETDSSTSPLNPTLYYLYQNKTKDFPSTVSSVGLSPILQSAWFHFNRVTLDWSPLSLLARTGSSRSPVLQPQLAAVHSPEQHRAAGEAPQIHAVFSLDELTLWSCWGFSLLPTMCHPNTHPGHNSTCQIPAQNCGVTLTCQVDYKSILYLLPELQPTWKCGLETHLANCLNKGSITFTNSDGSITSRISSSSFKNITSLGLWVFGQNFSKPTITWAGRVQRQLEAQSQHQLQNKFLSVWSQQQEGRK